MAVQAQVLTPGFNPCAGSSYGAAVFEPVAGGVPAGDLGQDATVGVLDGDAGDRGRSDVPWGKVAVVGGIGLFLGWLAFGGD